jgi:hypothetical protein
MIMVALLRIFLLYALVFGSVCNLLYATESGQSKAEHERIRMLTIAHLEVALAVMDEDHIKNPQEKHCGISDWDKTLVGLSNVDMARFHRQHNTLEIFNGWKNRMPVFVATARCHTNYTLQQYEDYAKSMETGTNICLSDQEQFKDLVLDLRPQAKVDRGIFIRGIYFTGSRKGSLTSLLLDQPNMINADHYFYAEDDPEYIQQMMNIFKHRKEKLTVFYYPDNISIDHSPYLSDLQNLTPMRRLSFFLRHTCKDLIDELLRDTSIVQQISQVNLCPLFIDLSYCQSSETAELVINTLGLKPELLTFSERILLYVVFKSEMDKHPQEFTWSKKYIEALDPNSKASK